jgi:gluconolactonase
MADERVLVDGAGSVQADPCEGPSGLAMGPEGLLCLCNIGGFALKKDDGIPYTAKQAADDPGRRVEAFHPDVATLRHLFSRCGGH